MILNMSLNSIYILALKLTKGITQDWIKKIILNFNITDSNDLKNKINKSLTLKQYEEFLKNIVKAKDIIEKSKLYRIYPCCILDDNFPKQILTETGCCVFFWYKGNLNLLNNEKRITIIGSRKACSDGLRMSYECSKFFIKKNYVIVSGLAKGCDTQAHKRVLDNKGKTIMILPSGLNNIYPKQNKTLFDSLIANGSLAISENQYDNEPMPFDFIARDRLQTSFSNFIFVGEATNNSGTIYAVKEAFRQNKLVFQSCYSSIDSLHIKIEKKYLSNVNIYQTNDFDYILSKISGIKYKDFLKNTNNNYSLFDK